MAADEAGVIMSAETFISLKIEKKDKTAVVVLSRPKVKNAFDEILIAELTEAIRQLGGDRDVRVIVLTGSGDVFSAGADINWMQKVAGYSYEDNFKDAMRLADLVETLYTVPQPTIARVNGACIGGATGLVCACDVAVASNEAFFALREILLGIAPAVISPYVIKKIGEGNARDYFLTGRRIDAKTAKKIGLVNEVATEGKLDEAVVGWVKRFLSSGPEAVKECKKLIARVSSAPIADVKEFTADVIARLRTSEEGKEGFNAFFEKRKPKWDVEK